MRQKKVNLFREINELVDLYPHTKATPLHERLSIVDIIDLSPHTIYKKKKQINFGNKE